MSSPPLLLVVIDTEEEFDWSAPFDRESTSVDAMRELHRGQEVCDRFDIRPVYVIDHPVASQENGWRPLKKMVDEGRAVIGTHLHPWVSPPFTEDLTMTNSFPGNLPIALEREKLERLTLQIETTLGTRPRIYKAGRYGIGPNTATILEQLGYEVDLSPAPPFDFRGGGGPDFSLTPNDPARIGPGRKLYSFPTTGDYIGSLATSRAGAHRLHRLATHPIFLSMHGPGILSRLRLLERIRLSPEGYHLEELKRLTLTLRERGLNVFSLTFHSPSLKPGCTPYVRNEKDLDQFLKTLHHYFDFFLHSLGGIALTPLELKRRLDHISQGADI
ncbi:MAG: WalW protein [Magnetococcales bacterium]|nr:WalW protein [Magnetococcales bacterium]MBF0151982.1 WalW protein [Magnetococcales bacterium]MBF0172592.1 WalW protein [Magnetococcales bacterium]MBF0348957.1 WalW protein [Magnetococcales bacterium]